MALGVGRSMRSVTELSHWNEFDFVVINDQFAQALADLQAIVRGQGMALAATPALTAPHTNTVLLRGSMRRDSTPGSPVMSVPSP